MTRLAVAVAIAEPERPHCVRRVSRLGSELRALLDGHSVTGAFELLVLALSRGDLPVDVSLLSHRALALSFHSLLGALIDFRFAVRPRLKPHIGEPLTLVSGTLSLVGQLLALIGDPLTLVRKPLAAVGSARLGLQIVLVLLDEPLSQLQPVSGMLAPHGDRFACHGDPLALRRDAFALRRNPFTLLREPKQLSEPHSVRAVGSARLGYRPFATIRAQWTRCSCFSASQAQRTA